MRKRILIILILALAQAGCSTSEETGFYKPVELSTESRQGFERLKREFLQLEEIKVGNGPVAAWGRKVTADIEVRYASEDGKPIYRGPAVSYFGMRGDIFIHNNVRENGMLSTQQIGIIVGLNGMAVGGKRRITVSPGLVCYEGAVGESVSKGANPKVTCSLILERAAVRKEELIVEAVLTASCTPVFLHIAYIYNGEFSCRDSEVPQRDPSAPIWRFYYAEPSHP